MTYPPPAPSAPPSSAPKTRCFSPPTAAPTAAPLTPPMTAPCDGLLPGRFSHPVRLSTIKPAKLACFQLTRDIFPPFDDCPFHSWNELRFYSFSLAQSSTAWRLVNRALPYTVSLSLSLSLSLTEIAAITGEKCPALEGFPSSLVLILS